MPPALKLPTVRSALKMGFEAAFALPAFAGYGEHWALDDEESAALSEQGEAVVASMPTAKVLAVSKAIGTWLPAMSLVMTVLVLTKARIEETRRKDALSKQANATRSAPNPPPVGHEAAAGNGSNGGRAPGTVTRDRAELFHPGE